MKQKGSIETICINDYIQKFNLEISKHEEHRYNSWVYCREAFTKANKNRSSLNYDYLALHLAFYLASWGMYRGSSFLFQSYTYKVHIGAVEILLKDDYKDLFTIDPFNSKHFQDVFTSIYNELNEYYSKLKDDIVNENTSNEDTSITLITKIIMGVYGCCPAYDTYFRKGISHYGIQATKDKHPAISELVNEIKNCNSFKTNIKKALLKLSANLSDAYTLMRVVDIVFWLKGKELIEEAKGEKNNDI